MHNTVTSATLYNDNLSVYFVSKIAVRCKSITEIVIGLAFFFLFGYFLFYSDLLFYVL